jgi:hypothetical protein
VGAVIRVGGPEDRQGAEFIALLQAHGITYAGRYIGTSSCRPSRASCGSHMIAFPALTDRAIAFPALTDRAIAFPALTDRAIAFPALTGLCRGRAAPFERNKSHRASQWQNGPQWLPFYHPISIGD